MWLIIWESAEIILFSLFKASIGCSPQEYITGFRLSRARELLAGTEYSIEIISGSCGYENPEAFSRAFKKKYQTTPLRYRAGVIEAEHNCPADLWAKSLPKALYLSNGCVCRNFEGTFLGRRYWKDDGNLYVSFLSIFYQIPFLAQFL